MVIPVLLTSCSIAIFPFPAATSSMTSGGAPFGIVTAQTRFWQNAEDARVREVVHKCGARVNAMARALEELPDRCNRVVHDGSARHVLL